MQFIRKLITNLVLVGFINVPPVAEVGEKMGRCSMTGSLTSMLEQDVSGREGNMLAEKPGASALAPRNVFVDLLRSEREMKFRD